MNRINVLGNVVNDVELRFSKNKGTAIAKLTLAVNEGFGDNRVTTFVNVTCFGKQAENSAKYLKKGSRIIATGSLRQNIWQDTNGTKHYDYYILADNINGIEFISNIITKEELKATIEHEVENGNVTFDNDTLSDSTPYDGDIPF